MHKHKRHHHFGHHHGGWHLGGWFWIIGLWVLFSSGHGIWPGILILVAISMIFGSVFREESRPPEPPLAPFEPHIPQPVPYPVAPKPAAEKVSIPVTPSHRADLLPTTCAHCGGPVRSYEVKWTGKQSAACSYCGSNLKMKK